MDESKKYHSFKIPGRQQNRENEAAQVLPQAKTAEVPLNEGPFYEIEYDTCPIPGVGKFVLKPQAIKEPEKDIIRELFGQMRDIARAHRSIYDFSRFFDRRIQSDNAAIFYKQALFMKDFTDDYADSVPFSQYFPCYQMMGYQQLRTYFTWRTAVRNGHVSNTSLSYVFVYIYELLNNIGVNDPQDGLDRLIFLWKAFRAYDKTVDKYVLKWLKDYHICYGLAHAFKAFVHENGLAGHYPGMADSGDSFDLFCTLSKYDIRKSVFFTESNIRMIRDCFAAVISRLEQVFTQNGLCFEEALFQPTRKMSAWTPFKDALFYQGTKQPDRRAVLSANEIYICKQGKWGFNTTITTEGGRQLIGYVIKQMESVLRRVMKYKFKLSADLGLVTHEAVGKLREAGLSLEQLVSGAVLAFYREATKTVVKVDHEALLVIRQEALSTQQKLIVPENEAPVSVIAPADPPFTAPQDKPSLQPSALSDAWESLQKALTSIEIKALSALWQGDMALKQCADECGVMLEVLVDGINEKATDFVGDNLIDEAFVLYDDYKEHVKELIG